MTLESLTNQLYRTFKVIVVEDGEDNTAEEVVRQYRGRLDISYCCLGHHGGRCEAANRGVELADTKYINFLDDDDYLFADHLETMAFLIKKHPGYRLFALDCMEGKIIYTDKADQTSFRYMEKRSWNRRKLSRDSFFFDNPLPIQAIVFERSLYLEVGGIDEKLEAFEDWDLWMRMLIDNDLIYMNKATSLFKTPFDKSDLEKREEFMGPYRPIMKLKAKEYRRKGNIEQISSESLENKEQIGENILTIIRPYREDESPVDAFSEIKHTKKWLLSLPARLVVSLSKKITGSPHERSILEQPFGRVVLPWKHYSGNEREDIVNDILCSKCWRMVK